MPMNKQRDKQYKADFSYWVSCPTTVRWYTRKANFLSQLRSFITFVHASYPWYASQNISARVVSYKLGAAVARRVVPISLIKLDHAAFNPEISSVKYDQSSLKMLKPVQTEVRFLIEQLDIKFKLKNFEGVLRVIMSVAMDLIPHSVVTFHLLAFQRIDAWNGFCKCAYRFNSPDWQYWALSTWFQRNAAVDEAFIVLQNQDQWETEIMLHHLR